MLQAYSVVCRLWTTTVCGLTAWIVKLLMIIHNVMGELYRPTIGFFSCYICQPSSPSTNMHSWFYVSYVCFRFVVCELCRHRGRLNCMATCRMAYCPCRICDNNLLITSGWLCIYWLTIMTGSLVLRGLYNPETELNKLKKQLLFH